MKRLVTARPALRFSLAIIWLAAAVTVAVFAQSAVGLLTDSDPVGGNTFATAASFGGQTNTGYLSPAAQAVDTGGDGDGYEKNPTQGFALDAATAEDRDSGTNTATSCSDAGKDRHRYYDYGISIPGGATIDGIEVRIDGRVDGTGGAPHICVELSWDGGTTWTAAKTTPTLPTVQGTLIVGTDSDTWGRVWNASTEFTNANFRIRFTDVASDTSRRFRVDWFALQITYTP